MEKIEVKRINPWGLGKLFAVVGFVCTVIITLILLWYIGKVVAQFNNPEFKNLYDQQAQAAGYPESSELIKGFSTIRNYLLLGPIFSGIFGFILGALSALVFNFMSKFWGGMKLTIKEFEKK